MKVYVITKTIKYQDTYVEAVRLDKAVGDALVKTLTDAVAPDDPEDISYDIEEHEAV